MAIAEILHGDNPDFTKWANKAEEFKQEFNEQLKTYALGLFPYRGIRPRPNESMLLYWHRLRGAQGADIIAVRNRVLWTSLAFDQTLTYY